MRAARILLTAAMLAAGYLAWVAWNGGAVAGCGQAADCDDVLGSKWSHWLGLPVSVPAVVVYAALLAATFAAGSTNPARQRLAWRMVIVLAVAVAGAALWFTGLQMFVLHSYCRWCLAAHLCGFSGAVLLLAGVPIRAAGPGLHTLRRCVEAGFAGVGLLVLGQIFSDAPSSSTQTSIASGAKRTPHGPLTLHDGQFHLDPAELPLIGAPDAPQVVVSLFDYTCAWCRKMHGVWTQTQQRYGSELAVITLAVPMAAECNAELKATPPAHQGACDYARLGLAVWRSDRSALAAFDHWMFAPAKPPPVAEAKDYAAQLVGRERLERALLDAWIDERLRANVALYTANSRELQRKGRPPDEAMSLPQAIAGGTIVVGALTKSAEVSELLAKELKLQLPGARNQPPADQEVAALREEIARLAKGQEAMFRELQEIRKLLPQPPSGPPPVAPGVEVSVAGRPWKGAKEARVTMVAFSDYQCEHCARFAKETLPRLEKEFISTGKVKLVLRDLPLPAHKDAARAAAAARCAAAGGKFWEMHDRLLANPQSLTEADLSAHAAAIGLEGGKFLQCLHDPKTAGAVQEDKDEAAKIGATVAPTFILGLTTPDDGKIQMIEAIIGAQPWPAFEAAINRVLTLAEK